MCLSRCVFAGPWFQLSGSGPSPCENCNSCYYSRSWKPHWAPTQCSLCPEVFFFPICGPQRYSSYCKSQLCFLHFCFTPYIIYHWINGRSRGRCLKSRANVILIRSLPGHIDFVDVWSRFPQYSIKPKFTRTGLNEPKKYLSLKQICDIHKPSAKLNNKLEFWGTSFSFWSSEAGQSVMLKVWKARNSSSGASWTETE